MKKQLNNLPLALTSFAKINLFLHVGPKRKDGYHFIETLFQEISLHDTLKFKPTPHSIDLQTNLRNLSSGQDNLVVKALTLLKKKLKIKKGMAVELKKNIPMGAGLGGGSSNAASALWAGWTLWMNRPVTNAKRRKRVPPILQACARKLGADVSFFLKGGRAVGKGRGEKLSLRPRSPKKWIVLIHPRVGVSTAKAYQWLDQSRVGKNGNRADQEKNSFERVVFPRFPLVRTIYDTLKKEGCGSVLMSGSGSSVFGFVNNKKEGTRLVRRLKKKSWDVFLVHTV